MLKVQTCVLRSDLLLVTVSISSDPKLKSSILCDSEVESTIFDPETECVFLCDIGVESAILCDPEADDDLGVALLSSNPSFELSNPWFISGCFFVFLVSLGVWNWIPARRIAFDISSKTSFILNTSACKIKRKQTWDRINLRVKAKSTVTEIPMGGNWVSNLRNYTRVRGLVSIVVNKSGCITTLLMLRSDNRVYL